MANFLANYVNKVDTKGRVSVPASFRTELGDEKTIYCMQSLADRAIDAYTREHLAEMTADYKARHGVNSQEFRWFNMVFKGGLFPITIDGDGRIILPEEMRGYAQIGDQATFVGAGEYFQIWEPGNLRAYQEEARAGTREAMYGLASGPRERRGA